MFYSPVIFPYLQILVSWVTYILSSNSKDPSKIKFSYLVLLSAAVRPVPEGLCTECFRRFNLNTKPRVEGILKATRISLPQAIGICLVGIISYSTLNNDAG
jgi:hypothetical protein